MSNIHPTAVVEDGAQIGKNVTIGPYAVVMSNVVLEDDVEIKAHAYIDGYTCIGEKTVVWPGAAIGTKTQDLKYRGEKTFVKIGANCEIREYVTINSSCGEGSKVLVGDNCLIMAYCHVAHNCELGNRVVMANNATLAGHVTVGNGAIIGGLSAVHQFVNIGRYSMTGGMSRVERDVLPYMIAAGIPVRLGGLNQVGLRRNNFSFEQRLALSQAFKILCRSGLSVEEALARIEQEVALTDEVTHLVDFCRCSKRGIIADGRSKARCE